MTTWGASRIVPLTNNPALVDILRIAAQHIAASTHDDPRGEVLRDHRGPRGRARHARASLMLPAPASEADVMRRSIACVLVGSDEDETAVDVDVTSSRWTGA